MANHKGLTSLKQVKNTIKIDRTFFLFQGILLLPLSLYLTYPFMSILILKFDQPQSFEKKP